MTARERLTKGSQETWNAMVECVLSGDTEGIPPYKVSAIRWARERGCTPAAIKNIGEHKVLSFHKKWQLSTKEKQRELKMRIPESLLDALTSRNASPDQEESLWVRFERVLGLRKPEEKIEFILSVFADLSDKELQHLGGDGDAQKPKRPGSD